MLVAGGFIVVIVLGLASALRPTGTLRRAVLFTNSPPRAATSVERHTVPGVASQPRIAPDPNAPLGQFAIFVSAPAETA